VKKFMADWKNPALLGAAVVVLLLLLMLIIQSGRSMNARLVSVGDNFITREDLLNRLKIMGANDILAEMTISSLMVNYARQQHITATEKELRQFDQYNEIRAAVNDKTLEEYVKEMGITMEQWHDFNSDQVLLTKLIVPEEDIKTAVPMYADKYTFPAWYRYRRYVITDEKKAKEAYELLKKPEGAAEVAQFSITEPGARPDGMRFHIAIPGMPPNDYPDIIKKLKSMKADEISQPFKLPTQEGVQPWAIVQALDTHPPEEPTVENRGMLIAKEELMRGNNMKYGQRQQAILSEAFQKIDVSFSPAIREFTKAFEQLSDMKRKSIYIPPAAGSPMPGLPGADSTPQGAAPAPQGPAPETSGK